MRPALLFRFVAVVLACALDVSAVSAASTSSDATQRTEAKAHYAQGASAYQAGRYHEAVEHFLTADRLEPSAALSFNAARAYEKLGDSARALEFYRDYLRRGAKSELESKVQKRVAELEKALAARGIQQLTILSEPEGAEIDVDGRVVGMTPKTLELPPGTHKVTLRKDGFVDTERELDLRADRAIDLSVTLSSEPPPEPSRTFAASSTEPERLAHDRQSPGTRPGPWITMGLGGAALVGAGVFELLRHSAQEDAEATPQARFPEYEDHYDSAQAHQTTARVLAGTGGVLVLVGGVWALLDARRERPEPTKTSVACGRSSCFGSVRVAF